MKKREVTALYEARIAELKRHNEHMERQKQKFVTDVYQLRNHPKVEPLKRQVLLNKYLRGRSYDEWIDYYDGHLDTQKNEIAGHEAALHNYARAEPKPIVAAMAIAIVLGLVAFGIFSLGSGSLTSFSVADTTPNVPNTEHATVIEVPPLEIGNMTNTTVVYGD